MMGWRDYLAVAALGVGVALIGSWAIASPGYMDAEYYFATARQLAQGNGLSEPFLWNYLDDPAVIPHPSHQYWMPGVSLLAAAGMSLLGGGFRAAQAPFVLLAGTISVLTAWLSDRTYPSRRRAWLAGALAAFPGFFLPYLLTIDAFALYAWLGAMALFAFASANQLPQGRRWLLAGALAGLCHWTRPCRRSADAAGRRRRGTAHAARRVAHAAFLIAGYLLVMLPWWARNLSEIGSPFPAGLARLDCGSPTMMTSPVPRLWADDARWWAQGLEAIAESVRKRWPRTCNRLLWSTDWSSWRRWRSGGAGGSRRDPVVRIHATYLVGLLLVMSFIFPFAGPRGGFFHSSVAVMPLIWILSAIGLEAFVEAGVRRRGWEAVRAGRIFGLAAIGMAALMTVFIYQQRGLGPTAEGVAWQASRGATPGDRGGIPYPAHHTPCGRGQRSPGTSSSGRRGGCAHPGWWTGDASPGGGALRRGLGRARVRSSAATVGALCAADGHPRTAPGRPSKIAARASGLPLRSLSEQRGRMSRHRLTKAELLPGVAIVFILLLYLVASASKLRLGFPLDDAWIHQTYARNLARLGEWSFIPGQPSAGSTAPLWTFALGLGHLLQRPPFAWTLALGGVTWIGMARGAPRLFAPAQYSSCRGVLDRSPGLRVRVASGWGAALRNGDAALALLDLSMLGLGGATQTGGSAVGRARRLGASGWDHLLLPAVLSLRWL